MSYCADKQVITAHTDGQTHRQTQATTIPEGQNWPRVKTHLKMFTKWRLLCLGLNVLIHVVLIANVPVRGHNILGELGQGHAFWGGGFKNTYKLLNLQALKFSPANKIHIFQCMVKIFCVEFQRVPLKFHTKYLTHTLKDAILYDVEILRALRSKSS